MKKLFLGLFLAVTMMVSGCVTTDSGQWRQATPEEIEREAQIVSGREVPKPKPRPYSMEEVMDMAAEAEAGAKVRAFDALTGGCATCLDSIDGDDIAVGDFSFTTDDSSTGNFYVHYWVADTGDCVTPTENSPWIIRADTCSVDALQGYWRLPSNFTTYPSTTPTITFYDLDATDYDANVYLKVDCSDVGSGTEDCDLEIWQQIAGDGTTASTSKTVLFDADGEIEILKSIDITTGNTYKINNSTVVDQSVATGAGPSFTSIQLTTPVLGTITSGVGTALTALNGENISNDTIDEDSIDWGSGAGQVDADSLGDGSTNAIITLTQETNFGTAYSATHTQGSDTALGAMAEDIDMNTSYQLTSLAAPVGAGEAVRTTADITETALISVTGGGDTTEHDHDGISENTSARHTQGTDTGLGAMAADINMNTSYQLTALAAPVGAGEAIRSTAAITEVALIDITDGGDTTEHDHDGISENTSARHTAGTDTALGAMAEDIDMNTSYQLVSLAAPAANGEAIRQTAKITEAKLETLDDNVNFTEVLTVDTGSVGITGNVADSSVLTLGPGASSVSGSNTGDNTVATAAASQAITDNALVTVDDASGAVDNEYARFTAAGLESRTPTEMVGEFDDIAWTYGGVVIDFGSVTTFELWNSTSDMALGVEGQIGLQSTDDQLVFHGGAAGEIQGEAALSLLEHMVITFDPAWAYDQESTYRVLPIMYVGDDFVEGFTMVEWKIAYVAGDPTTELDADIMCDTDPDYNSATNATSMDAIDTTAGAATETTGFGSATCANGSLMYIHFDADPTDANVLVTLDIWGYAEED